MAGSERILLVGGVANLSGVPRHISLLAQVLSDMGQVHVASEPDEGGFARLEEAGAHHIAVPGLRSGLNPLRMLRGLRGLVRVLRGRDWRVVWLHARMATLLGRTALALRLWRPAPGAHVVMTYHGLPFGRGHRPGLRRLSRGIEKLLLSACPRLDLVFLSPGQADRMRSAMGARRLSRHRVHILRNGSDLGELPPRKGQRPGRTLVMTGRSGYQKNYALAVRLFALLPEDCHLVLAGAGTDRADVQRRLGRLAGPQAAARITFRGPVADVRHLLVEADGYMLTSRYEGVPIGALEAFEAGLPLILTEFESAADFTDHHPLVLRLEMTRASLPRDAAAVSDLLDRYIAGRETYAAQIRAAWAADWSNKVFERQARALVRAWLGG
ncbi:glycosyltransferase [Sulfitobacter sp. HNIBRBA3233]|uniref:glycosyltransferase n=1 Tax=Sulfitobacter marinivivus TaxID=3158558 RepID=UPI0032E02F90